MIWTREEYLAHMTFEASPREMFCELFGPLVGLDAEWRAQAQAKMRSRCAPLVGIA